MPLFTMDDFRDEMKRRDVYKNGKRVLFRDERERRKIATGAPHLVESPKKRTAAQRRADRQRFWQALHDSAVVRLELFAGRSADDQMPCPWGAIFGGECLTSCRCCGARTVTVSFMRAHYRRVVAECIDELAKVRR